MSIQLHPSIESPKDVARAVFEGGTLVCRCRDHQVKVRVTSSIAHNHACGCTKCWKPEGAAFSVVAVVPTEHASVLENGDKLSVIDDTALIRRFACNECGTHMYGPVEREHAFQGLTFIHPELFEETEWPAPEFAAFVSSIIESGVNPEKMPDVRAKLKQAGLEPYDCLSPALMDYLATWSAKRSGALPA